MYQHGHLAAAGRVSILAAAVAAATLPAQQARAQALEEVVVTATRRATSTQDVPYNISAYSGDLLDKREIINLGEFVRQVPGVSFNDRGIREAGNNSTLVMRGLSAEPGNGAGEIPNLARPTVSTYVGETPVYYNLRLTDIDRVEVLRGPQGTLYGAGSLGGTLRIMPNKPDPSVLEGSLRTSISTTEDADDPNYDFDAMINLPLGERAALRVSGGHTYLAGFVDAINLGLRDESGAFLLEDPSDFVGSGPDRSGSEEDSNEGSITHLRTSLLWNVNDDIEALFTYHYQESETDNYQAESLGEDRTLSLHGTNPFESDMNLGALEITANLGFATLTSATSYYERTTETQVDASGLYEDFFSFFYFYYPRISTVSSYDATDESFVQELRLTSNSDGPLGWIVGAFYLDQEMTFETGQSMPGFEAWFDASGLASYFGVPIPITSPPDLVYGQDRTTDFTERALFGELSYQLTDAWQVTGGVRVFEQEIGNDDTSILPTCYTILEEGFGEGFYCGMPPLGGSANSSNDTVNDEVFKLNTSYELNDDTNLYATWSQGFRNGGVNALPDVGFIDETLGGEFPNINSFSADKADNYEVGIKGFLAERSVRYSLAAYYIEWKDPQARIVGFNSGIDGVSNATADAESRGLELEIDGVVGDRFNYSLGYAYTNAEFVEDGELYTTAIADGTRLPGHSKHMLAGSLGYTVPVAGNDLNLAVDAVYRSDYENALPGGPGAFTLDSYTIWNAHVSYEIPSWTFRLFAKNLSDENAAMSASLVSPQTNRLVLTRPRTVGLSLTYQFQ
ncbi:TonB-dependent receptor [Pseudohaliea sp.]|uniref:TonB-dependent receptor n=1 Tax=Pseudohaliea sp. TaxID=2740289 RepID=UPI0032ED3A78